MILTNFSSDPPRDIMSNTEERARANHRNVHTLAVLLSSHANPLSSHSRPLISSSVLAVVVAGEGMEECVQEFGPLHLSVDTASANAEVELFFPDFLASQENQDEPQTQMQIEQSKEGK